MKKLPLPMPCPCGSGQPYRVCCGPWHAGWHDGASPRVYALTPEALMRSRYSAFVLSLTDYLLGTWHPSTAPAELLLQPVKWLGLEVRQTQTEGDTGRVEFVARCREAGRAQRLHETSRFVREQGRWYYLDGLIDTAS
jgi:SEC-C motif-containing protein